jgi:chitodextrinase
LDAILTKGVTDCQAPYGAGLRPTPGGVCPPPRLFCLLVGLVGCLLAAGCGGTGDGTATGVFAGPAAGQNPAPPPGNPPANDTSPPSQPGSLTAQAAGATAINLSWPASTDNVGVAGYVVQRCQGGGCTAFAQIASVTTTSYADTGLISATSYSYRVYAFDQAGNISRESPVATAMTDAPPPPPPPPDTTPPTPPTNLVASSAGASAINLSWTASTDNTGVTGYRVERCQGVGCANFVQIAAPTTTSLNNTGLTAATSYSYRVRARDAAGNLSAYSAVATATTDAPPPPQADTTPPSQPTNLSAVADGPFAIGLSWLPSTDDVGVTGYRLERCQGTGCSSFAQIAAPTTTSFADSGLTAATNYRYRVRAVDAASNLSEYSAIAAATTAAAPPPPTGTLPSWVSALVPGQWHRIPGTAISSVTPSPVPPGNGPESKVIAWTSFVVDRRTSRVYSLANGGHNDYAGNEVDELALNAEGPSWRNVLGPTPNGQLTNCQSHYADGRPASRHTYYGVTLNEANDRFMLFGGAHWCQSGGFHAAVDSYNIAANTWSPANSHPALPTALRSHVLAATAVPATGDVYLFGGFNSARWNRSANTFTLLSPSGPAAWGDEAMSAYDTTRSRILVISDIDSNVYNPATNAWTRITLTGTGAASVRVLGGAMFYVEALDRFLVRLRSAGSVVYQINPSTFEVSELPTTGGASVPRTINGPYNKFLYVPLLRGAVYVPEFNTDAWFLRLH